MVDLRAAALLSLLVTAAPALAAPRAVGLVVHPVVNVSDAESKAIAGELAQAMARRYEARIFVAERHRLPAELPEGCVSEPECSGEVADRISADQVIFLVMVKVGSTVQVDATWVDPRSGRVLPRDSFELEPSPSERAKVIAEVAPTMIPRGEVPPSGKGAPARAEPTPAIAAPPPAVAAADAPTSGLAIGAWIAAGASAVALTSGVALILATVGDYDAILNDERCNVAQPVNPARCTAALDAYGTKTAIGSGVLVGAAFAGAISVALFAADGEGSTVALKARGASLVWEGHF